MSAKPNTFYVAVWAYVRRVPRGRVVTYGQVATALGSPRAARAVGYALFNIMAAPPGGAVPWHRVLNARGEISIGGALQRPDLQRARLEAEGLKFDAHGRVPLAQYRWQPRTSAPYTLPRQFI